MTTDERFWAKVIEGSDGCWLWTAGKTHNGYGRFKVEGRGVYAHRYAYERLVAGIPPGLVIDHLCRVRACVNPWHMEPVTDHLNMLRGESPAAQHARQTHCGKGHRYTPGNTYRRENGWRICRTCHLARQRGYDQKRRRPDENAAALATEELTWGDLLALPAGMEAAS